MCPLPVVLSHVRKSLINVSFQGDCMLHANDSIRSLTNSQCQMLEQDRIWCWPDIPHEPPCERHQVKQRRWRKCSTVERRQYTSSCYAATVYSESRSHEHLTASDFASLDPWPVPPASDVIMRATLEWHAKQLLATCLFGTRSSF